MLTAEGALAGPAVDCLVRAAVARVVRAAVLDGSAGTDRPAETDDEVGVAVPVYGKGAIVLAVLEVGNVAVVVLDVV